MALDGLGLVWQDLTETFGVAQGKKYQKQGVKKKPQDTSSLTADELREIRIAGMTEQELAIYGTETDAGLLGGWLPEHVQHTVPPRTPLATPAGTQKMQVHGGSLVMPKRQVLQSVEYGKRVRHPEVNTPPTDSDHE